MEKLIRMLRKELNLKKGDATDDEILEVTKGTFFRAGVEMGIAWDEFIKAVNDEIDRIKEKLQTVKRR